MIVRQVHDAFDLLVCTDCHDPHHVDRLHHVALNLVDHRCGNPPAWTIPPRPTRNKKRNPT